MPPREPRGVVVRKPGAARFILPNKCLQRQIDSGRLHRLHERRAASRVTEDQDFGWPKRQPGFRGPCGVVDARKYGQAFALTAVSSLLIVSVGPYALRRVINPSAAIACTPHRHISAVDAKTFARVTKPVMSIIRPVPAPAGQAFLSCRERSPGNAAGFRFHRRKAEVGVEQKLIGPLGNVHRQREPAHKKRDVLRLVRRVAHEP